MITIFSLLLQASPNVDLGPAIQQIGIGALIAVPAYFTAWQLWKDNRSLRSASSTEHTLALARERELLDRIAPLLATAADILAKTPERFDRALSGAQNATEKTELDRRMAQLEEVIRLAAQGRSS